MRLKSSATILIALSLCLSAAGQMITHSPEVAAVLAKARTVNSYVAMPVYLIQCGEEGTCTADDFDGERELTRGLKAVRPLLYKYLRESTARHADLSLYFSLSDNQRVTHSGTITLTVFDTDTQNSLWEESRGYNDLDNDTYRLMEHFVAYLTYRGTRHEQEVAQKKDYCTDNPEADEGYCASSLLYIEDYQAAQKKKAN